MRHATDDRGWRALFASDDPAEARVVATCVAAMEFDVRMTPHDTIGEGLDDGDGGTEGIVVEVPANDWAVLAEVLDDILAEQAQFDAFLVETHGRSTRAQRRLLITMIVIVGALAVVGAIDL